MAPSRRAAAGLGAAALLMACAAVLFKLPSSSSPGRQELLSRQSMLHRALPASWLSSSDDQDSPLLDSSDEDDQVLASTTKVPGLGSSQSATAARSQQSPAAATSQAALAPETAVHASEKKTTGPQPSALRAPQPAVKQQLGKAPSSGQSTGPAPSEKPAREQAPAAHILKAVQTHAAHTPASASAHAASADKAHAAPADKGHAAPAEKAPDHNIRAPTANGHPPGWKDMIKRAEATAKRLAERHPRAILGSHWRDGQFSSSLKQIIKEDSTAAEKAKTALHKKDAALERAHLKHEGIYMPRPKPADAAVGRATVEAAEGRKPAPGHAAAAAGSRAVEPVAAARYPAVSFFAKLRERSPPSHHATTHSSRSRMDRVRAGREELAGGRQELAEARGGDDEDARGEGERGEERRSERGDERGDERGAGGYYYTHGYENDIPGGEAPETADEARARKARAQARLARKWREEMEHPRPVTMETRADVLDPLDTHLPAPGFRAKKRELAAFTAALRTYESDPGFNPVVLLQAHNLVRYGVMAPESDHLRDWRVWYREVADKAQALAEEVASMAAPRYPREEWDHGEDAHRPMRRRASAPPPDEVARSVAGAYEAEMAARARADPGGRMPVATQVELEPEAEARGGERRSGELGGRVGEQAPEERWAGRDAEEWGRRERGARLGAAQAEPRRARDERAREERWELRGKVKALEEEVRLLAGARGAGVRADGPGERVPRRGGGVGGEQRSARQSLAERRAGASELGAADQRAAAASVLAWLRGAVRAVGT